jgi:hypothetical protein
MLHTEQNRENSTRHGLHLNGWGKVLLGNALAATVIKLLQPNEVIPIFLEWRVSIDRSKSENHNNIQAVHLNTRASTSNPAANSRDNNFFVGNVTGSLYNKRNLNNNHNLT